MSDYYGVLGVSRNASENEIRQAYRKLARQHHPDVNREDKSSEELFKSINEAYSVLSDQSKRRRYDRHGDNWEHSKRLEQEQARSRRSSRIDWPHSSGGDDLLGGSSGQGSIFDRLFSNLGGERAQPRAAEYPVEITLEEANQGSLRVLGLESGRRIEVKIPAGVDTGSRVHIPARGTGQGEIYLVVSVRPHAGFQRRGKDLYSDVDVPLEDAILGGDVNVTTLTGQVSLTIPPETQNGQRFRLARRGMPDLNNPSSKGSLYATVKVTLPTGLSGQERELFQAIKDLRNGAGPESGPANDAPANNSDESESAQDNGHGGEQNQS